MTLTFFVHIDEKQMRKIKRLRIIGKVIPGKWIKKRIAKHVDSMVTVRG